MRATASAPCIQPRQDPRGCIPELSAARRLLLHRRVARALERVHAGDLDAVSAQVATHYEQGGLPTEAVPYFQRAAGRAQGIFANAEAIRLLKRGLALLASLPPSQERDERHHVDHRGRWADPGRWPGAFDSRVWIVDRQPARGGRRPGRRHVRDGQRRSTPGPVPRGARGVATSAWSRHSCFVSIPSARWSLARCCGRWSEPERSCSGTASSSVERRYELNGWFAFRRYRQAHRFRRSLDTRTVCGIVCVLYSRSGGSRPDLRHHSSGGGWSRRGSRRTTAVSRAPVDVRRRTARACSGTGAPTSSTSSAMRPSTCTSGRLGDPDDACRRCTCIRSTVRRVA